MDRIKTTRKDKHRKSDKRNSTKRWTNRNSIFVFVSVFFVILTSFYSLSIEIGSIQNLQLFTYDICKKVYKLNKIANK